jgi:hypothetical protein
MAAEYILVGEGSKFQAWAVYMYAPSHHYMDSTRGTPSTLV